MYCAGLYGKNQCVFHLARVKWGQIACACLWAFYAMPCRISMASKQRPDMLIENKDFFVCVFVYSVCVSIFLSVYLSVCLCIRLTLSVYLSAWLLSVWIFLVTCLPVYLFESVWFTYLFAYLNVCLYIYLSINPCAHMSPRMIACMTPLPRELWRQELSRQRQRMASSTAVKRCILRVLLACVVVQFRGRVCCPGAVCCTVALHNVAV